MRKEKIKNFFWNVLLLVSVAIYVGIVSFVYTVLTVALVFAADLLLSKGGLLLNYFATFFTCFAIIFVANVVKIILEANKNPYQDKDSYDNDSFY